MSMMVGSKRTREQAELISDDIIINKQKPNFQQQPKPNMQITDLEQRLCWPPGTKFFHIVGGRGRSGTAVTVPVPLVYHNETRTCFKNFQDFYTALRGNEVDEIEDEEEEEIVRKEMARVFLEHVMEFFLKELETTGLLHDTLSLYLNGVFTSQDFQILLTRYCKRYIMCRNCKGFDNTAFDEDGPLTFLKCEMCGCGRLLPPIDEPGVCCHWPMKCSKHNVE